MSEPLRASCLCGSVAWEVDGLSGAADMPAFLVGLVMSHCHCGRCRKTHGAPYATYVSTREAQFRFTSGRDLIVKQGESRPFCRTCGSVVPDGVAWKGRVGMPAGNFDGDPGLRPTAHIFVAHRAPWVKLNDDLAKFDAYPEGFPFKAMETRPPVDEPGRGARGSCICGEVAYIVTGAPLRSRTCHCGRCRKAGSAAHVSYLVTDYDGVEITKGEGLIETFKVPEARYFKHAFCRACGSSMPRKDRERGITIIPMGSLDDPPPMEPGSHIYVGSMAPWDTITDDLPQHAEH